MMALMLEVINITARMNQFFFLSCFLPPSPAVTLQIRQNFYVDISIVVERLRCKAEWNACSRSWNCYWKL